MPLSLCLSYLFYKSLTVSPNAIPPLMYRRSIRCSLIIIKISKMLLIYPCFCVFRSMTTELHLQRSIPHGSQSSIMPWWCLESRESITRQPSTTVTHVVWKRNFSTKNLMLAATCIALDWGTQHSNLFFSSVDFALLCLCLLGKKEQWHFKQQKNEYKMIAGTL